MKTTTLTRVLHLDAGANALAGIALIVVAGWVAGPLGLGSAWPVRLLGLALTIYGVENLLVARRTTTAGLAALIAIDLGFAAAALGVAIADPTAAEPWARWLLVGVADLSATMGVVKLLGLRSLRGDRVVSGAR